jgi:tetratricopeptide (TPR) repeat protein
MFGVAELSREREGVKMWDQGHDYYERGKRVADHDEAIADFTEAIRCYGPADGPHHPDLEFVYQERALLYYRMGEKDKARDDLIEAARIAPPQDQDSIRHIRNSLGL